MAKFPSLITNMATFALLAYIPSCTPTAVTTPPPRAAETPATSTCSTTRLPSRYVYQPEATCVTCSCATPKTRIPCTTPAPVTNTVTTLLPYISDCTLYYGCQTRCSCDEFYCTWPANAMTKTA